jgi:hypothetical protein
MIHIQKSTKFFHGYLFEESLDECTGNRFFLCEERRREVGDPLLGSGTKDQLDQTYEAFISPRSQILNQKPELVDC